MQPGDHAGPGADTRGLIVSEPSRFPGVIAVAVILGLMGVCLLAMRALRSHTEADIDRDVHP